MSRPPSPSRTKRRPLRVNLTGCRDQTRTIADSQADKDIILATTTCRSISISDDASKKGRAAERIIAPCFTSRSRTLAPATTQGRAMSLLRPTQPPRRADNRTNRNQNRTLTCRPPCRRRRHHNRVKKGDETKNGSHKPLCYLDLSATEAAKPKVRPGKRNRLTTAYDLNEGLLIRHCAQASGRMRRPPHAE